MNEKILVLSDKNMVNDIRTSIDNLDSAFMFLLAERMRVIVKIGIVKKESNLNFAYSEERLKDLERIYSLGKSLNLNQDLIKGIFNRIYREALDLMDSLKEEGAELLGEQIQDLALEDLRQNLLHLDLSLCYLLVERFRLVNRIGEYKRRNNIQPLAPKRWQEVLETKSGMAEQLGIPGGFVQDILNMIHEEALRLEKKIIQ